MLYKVNSTEDKEVILAYSFEKNFDAFLISKPIENIYPYLNRGEFCSYITVKVLEEK